MKRKKPPVALISTLVVSVLCLVIASGAWKFYTKTPEEQQQQLQQEAIDRARAQQANQQPSNQKINTGKEVDDLQKRLQASGAKTPSTDSGEMMRKATMPTVVMPEQVIHKPTRNPGTTSSQWYDNK